MVQSQGEGPLTIQNWRCHCATKALVRFWSRFLKSFRICWDLACWIYFSWTNVPVVGFSYGRVVTVIFARKALAKRYSQLKQTWAKVSTWIELGIVWPPTWLELAGWIAFTWIWSSSNFRPRSLTKILADLTRSSQDQGKVMADLTRFWLNPARSYKVLPRSWLILQDLAKIMTSDHQVAALW